MIVGNSRRKNVMVAQQNAEPAVPAPETNEQSILSFIEGRDYSGAATYIDFLHKELNQPYTKDMKLWHGYALFHSGQYDDAIDVYEKMLKEEPDDTMLWLYISSCQFYLRDFENARDSANKGPNCDFKTRLLFHIAHQTNDDKQLLESHSQLVGTLQNQLSLAAIHYMRSHFQEAIDIYQKLLMEHPDFLALNVYIAMCQFKLDNYDESNEAVDVYLQINSDSAVALNLKSCDYLRIFDANTAESQLLQIRKFSSATYGFVDSLINHNLCIFHNGDDGFTILPKLVGVIPEARFNLAILYMRESNAKEAYNLLQDFQPLDISESILRATVLLAYGQLQSEPGPIDEANQIFSEVGNMDMIKNTVEGRQALATTKFIQSDYERTLQILQTIEDKIGDTDEFNYNIGMTYCGLEKWAEAERRLLMVKNPAYTREIFYVSFLCKCYIMNRKPNQAFILYTESINTEDAKLLLQIISTHCYQQGQYYYAMKAYNILAQFDLDPVNRQGMIASAVGVFRNVLSRKESPDKLQEVREVLESDPSAEEVRNVINKYIETSGEFETAL
ncbi:hypothetical protein TVAG_038480 [Trichomonas vaginalis G3]|uniref:Intraflagellar transport protein 56 n=1 Tax=Trichomonas vaginalis (strain ATCC PRA-98 / G3) TaxID=412133 RepID=A2DY04_TRIV3|nr:hypothetical protein TVAGG3_0960760 [Trichomonas vaginalis G3]EAY14740.1 hypothetical protein TVAG_038480 [Trichomonas vaginalis G3]KAI5487889.1 hypothetical protein TVAGG3_0960760 [Trichomonas vaginalis G3]|eukprot:XP_001326963.1 hypothetical protein [Trichomonas vaginalis G3]